MSDERMIAGNVVDLVGGTPMVKLNRSIGETGAEVLAKLESMNPGGSVKDRIGVAMIEDAERRGEITPGKTTVIEATSGNTGIALACVCAAKGYELVLTLPEGMSRERQSLLRLFGVRVELIESMGGMNEAVDAARKLAAGGGDYFLPDQFSNPANPEVHRQTTAEEIWQSTGGKIDGLVAGVGTGGTITGAGERLKQLNPQLKVFAIEPAASPVLSGGDAGPHKIQGIGAGFVPPILNVDVIDEVIAVDDDDAIKMACSLSLADGVLCGISGGAAVHAAREVASRPEFSGRRIAVIVPDSGERYISMPFFSPQA